MDIAGLYNLDGQKVYYELVKLEKAGMVRRRWWVGRYPAGTIMWYSIAYDAGMPGE